jgi:adenylate cyclase
MRCFAENLFAVNHDDAAAWIESSAGEIVPISGQLEFGRDSGHIRIGSPKASRRHAMINPQSRETRIEYWFIDLGSANGSFVNGRRVVQPMPLKDGDRIRLVDREFVFHLVERLPANEEAPQSELTMLESRSGHAWLLVADIVDSTPLIRTVPAEQLAGMIGRWLRECASVIEETDGSVNRYLGDGFLAYWMGDEGIASRVTSALCKLRARQSRSELAFRLVLHHGEVKTGS